MHPKYMRDVFNVTQAFFDDGLKYELMDRHREITEISQSKLLHVTGTRNYAVAADTFLPSTFEIIFHMESKSQLRISGQIAERHNPINCKLSYRNWFGDWKECEANEDMLQWYAYFIIGDPVFSEYAKYDPEEVHELKQQLAVLQSTPNPS